LSENETWAVVEFLLTHPNVYVVNSMDTSVPMHLRPPSTSPSEERMYPEDLEWYRIFDEAGKKITGYERAGDVYNDYGDGNPLFGHGPDFGYWYYGAIWYGDEIWNGGRFKDFNNDDKKDQADMLIWDDSENNGEGFMEWKKWTHPVYGEIELGGFDPKFFSQNPPAAFLNKWAGNQAFFNLEMAKALPLLEWENLEVKKIKSYKADSADYQITVSFRNKGRFPTALKQAWLVKIVKEDMVTLDFDTAGFPKGKPLFREISEKKKEVKREDADRYRDEEQRTAVFSVTKKVPFTAGGSVTQTVFRLRFFGDREVKGKANVISTRGGVLKDKNFIIQPYINR
ncbi:MAG: peptidase, partial [Bacteroidales bacterium]|nr:peptidase [Bacteroidales bacterium]